MCVYVCVCVCVHMSVCMSVGFAGGHQSEPAAAQIAVRAHQVPGQDIQRLAHRHSSAGIPCRAVPTRELPPQHCNQSITTSAMT